MRGGKGYRKGHCPDCSRQFVISPFGRRDQGEKGPVWYFVTRCCIPIAMDQAKRLVFADPGDKNAVRRAVYAEIQEKKALWASMDAAERVRKSKKNPHIPLLARSGLYWPPSAPGALCVLDWTGVSILPVVS